MLGSLFFRLIEAAHRQDSIESVSPYRFQAPLSPHLAAAKAHRSIDGSALVQFMETWLTRADIVLAEGAGGLLVPLGDHLTYGDAVAKTPYSLIVVAPNVLGTINATLLTIEAARRRGIHVTGVVLNRTPSAEFGNAAAISTFGQVPILGEIPELPTDVDQMAEGLEHHIDLSFLHL